MMYRNWYLRYQTIDYDRVSLIFLSRSMLLHINTTDISYQIRGAEFRVMHGMEKPKLSHSGTCTSIRTRHVTLKSPLLLQFPYCKLSINNTRRSNYILMNVLFCTRALFS